MNKLNFFMPYILLFILGCMNNNPNPVKYKETTSNFCIASFEGNILEFIDSLSHEIVKCSQIIPNPTNSYYSSTFDFCRLESDKSKDSKLRFQILRGETENEIIVEEKVSTNIFFQYKILKLPDYSVGIVSETKIDDNSINQVFKNTGFFLFKEGQAYYFGFGHNETYRNSKIRAIMKVNCQLYPEKKIQFWHDGLSFVAKISKDSIHGFVAHGKLIDSNKVTSDKLSFQNIISIFSDIDTIRTDSSTFFIPKASLEYNKTYPWILNGGGFYQMGVNGPVIIWH